MTIQTDGPRARGAAVTTTGSIVYGLLITTAPSGPNPADIAREDAPWDSAFARSSDGLQRLADRARQQVTEGRVRPLRSQKL